MTYLGDPNENITIFEVLKDAARSLQNSKYQFDFILKDGFVLMALLHESDALSYVRETTDIDLSFSSHERWECFVKNLPEILTSMSTLGLKYALAYRRGFDKNPNSDSITLEASTDEYQTSW